MHWLWKTSPREHVGHLVDHAQYDCRSHLLRHVHRSRNRTHPVFGLIQTTIPRKGKDLTDTQLANQVNVDNVDDFDDQRILTYPKHYLKMQTDVVSFVQFLRYSTLRFQKCYSGELFGV